MPSFILPLISYGPNSENTVAKLILVCDQSRMNLATTIEGFFNE